VSADEEGRLGVLGRLDDAAVDKRVDERVEDAVDDAALRAALRRRREDGEIPPAPSKSRDVSISHVSYCWASTSARPLLMPIFLMKKNSHFFQEKWRFFSIANKHILIRLSPVIPFL
jgi:hypothetical protein